MKKILFICLIALVSATTITAAPAPDVNKKVLKVFHEAFPEVTQPKWYSFENYFEVFFTNPDNSSCRIDYDTDGNVLRTIRYYEEQALSPVIRAKVNEKYPDTKIFGVTEICNNDQVSYHIVLENDKYWYNVESDATGKIRLDKKLLKAK